ncbi:putative Tad (Tight adherence macromolecular transport) pilin TadF [Serratia fonticola]|jgi:Flp pilus assembly protein TadG|uniref:Putative Tad (Tight adherence macromolecular transport) pilin TadF n=1 Tax=Serratia fonticola TaxID=47917 RepID=A0A559T3Z0_SERFO|nr:tight adherence pilus pseudopilin TadF [Serratia fonticola]TQI78177.1 putative Tad (Tight adherence macromolecular transport) pilin TadF [Serratia fonticola]TQI94825.1 putative Tad (Tight adherence macromolecular transport) pilin TadF [Serratia fonticola]TVZ69323.1 putative Tad (Tight adherence macromolecular transport) pilin TadF [Serratia fonticola]
MTIISKHFFCEKGTASIEGTILSLFFVGMLIYTFQQSYVMTMTYSASKLSSQIATLISQRNVLFSDTTLSQSDINNIRSFIPVLKEDNSVFDIYIEEVSYHNGTYNVLSLQAKTPQCVLNKRLSSYSLGLQTSFGKKNSLYRVSVCKKISEAFFSSSNMIVSGITVLPGQHH